MENFQFFLRFSLYFFSIVIIIFFIGKKLDHIAEKSSKQPGAKYLSLLNRGQIQGLLGQVDAARETYNRVAENDEPGIFRTWRVQAIAGIVRLDSSPASKKYEAAVARGEEQLRMGDLREKDRPEGLDLQLAIAEARIAVPRFVGQAVR